MLQDFKNTFGKVSAHFSARSNHRRAEEQLSPVSVTAELGSTILLEFLAWNFG